MNKNMSPVVRDVAVLLTVGLFASAGWMAPGLMAQDWAGSIKIGFISERAGAYQGYGIPSYEGTRLAMKHINDSGGAVIKGKHYRFNLIDRESRTDERQASAASVELIQDEKVKFLFGAIGRMAPIVLQLSEPNKVIYFTSSSSAAGQLDKTKYMVITLPPIEMRAHMTAKGIKHFFPNAKRVALLLGDEATTDEISKQLKDEFVAQGLEVVADDRFAVGATDVSAQLTRIRAAKPDVLFPGFGLTSVAPIVRTNKEINAAPAYFVYAVTCQNGVDWGVDRPFAANSLAGADLNNPRPGRPAELVAEYKQFTGDQNPKNLQALTWNYDFYFILRKAIEAAGTFEDTDAILREMRKITYDGVAGKIRIDEKNRAIFGFDMCLVKNASSPIELTHIDP